MKHEEHESLGGWVSMLYRYREIYLGRGLRPHNIGPGQLRILIALHRALKRNREVTQTDIARRQRLDKGAMAKSVKRLVDQGFIRRQRSARDGRVRVITLTDKANSRIDEFRRLQRGWNNVLVRGISGGETRSALELLRRMAENAGSFLGVGRFGKKHKE